MKVPIQQMIKMTANYCGYSQEVTKDILLGYAEVVHRLLLEGHEAKLPNLGTFKLQIKKSQPAKEMLLPKTGEVVMLDAKPTYQKPIFHFLPAFSTEIRKATEDNIK